jgi:uncharacterized BrkB/YihY/UPF0761 family membrane protein
MPIGQPARERAHEPVHAARDRYGDSWIQHLVTSILWLVLALFSSLFFSSTMVSDSREYGTIGVVFALLTWFALIGMVIVLGAALGAVRQRRAAARVTPRG